LSAKSLDTNWINVIVVEVDTMWFINEECCMLSVGLGCVKDLFYSKVLLLETN